MTAESSVAFGDASFESLVAPHQSALLAHCYRMTGSLPDAEDALQETLLRAWRSLDSFEGRSSLRTWLFRIATNSSLRVLEQRSRRVLPVDLGPPSEPSAIGGPPLEESAWVTPFPGTPVDASPAATYESKESVRLAFIAALQTLPGRQRAALLLRDVLGFSAAETAEALESSVASANSALQRARQAMADRPLEARGPDASDDTTHALVERFVAAWVGNDVDALVTMLAADVELSMPPEPMWFRGVGDVATFLRAVPLSGRLRWHAVPVVANGQPAFAVYDDLDSGSGLRAHGINVLTVSGDRISSIVAFRTPSLFPSFGLAATLPAG